MLPPKRICPPNAESAEAPPEFMKSGCVQSAPVSITATVTLPGFALAAVKKEAFGSRFQASNACTVKRSHCAEELYEGSFGVATVKCRMWFGSIYWTNPSA